MTSRTSSTSICSTFSDELRGLLTTTRCMSAEAAVETRVFIAVATLSTVLDARNALLELRASWKGRYVRPHDFRTPVRNVTEHACCWAAHEPESVPTIGVERTKMRSAGFGLPTPEPTRCQRMRVS